MMSETLQVRPSLLHQLQEHFRVDAVEVTQFEASNNRFQHHVLTRHTEMVECVLTPTDFLSCSGKIIRTGEPLNLPSVAASKTQGTCSFMKAEGLNAYLGAPLFLADKCVGALAVMNKKSRIWSDEELQKLWAYAALSEKVGTAVSLNAHQGGSQIAG